jgi:uncharacterized protein YcbX
MSSDIDARIARLFIYPVKSCAGIEVQEAELTDTGLDLDRAWMVVDERGEFVSQRELPRMALIRPTLRLRDVVLRAPGMLALHLDLETVEAPATVRVWDDEVQAYDMGDIAAQWFTDFLGRRLRLARFDPEVQRPSDRKWTGDDEAFSQFADAYPLLVASEASLAGLNEKLAAAGRASVGLERFRPNIVLAGMEAHDEDRLETMRIAADDGEVVLRPVKPCVRCTIPDVDPASGETDPAVSDVLRSYRRNEAMGGAVTFAMNAIPLEGLGRTLRVGQKVAGNFRFG